MVASRMLAHRSSSSCTTNSRELDFVIRDWILLVLCLASFPYVYVCTVISTGR
uniref:Uncharacterized protein n=1 Tax=Arundo donax TaxID=35708 RepID=A0A0A9EMZ1_ARUDO